jgi:hypothetical protein
MGLGDLLGNVIPLRESPVSKCLGILLFSSGCFFQSLDTKLASPFFSCLIIICQTGMVESSIYMDVNNQDQKVPARLDAEPKK